MSGPIVTGSGRSSGRAPLLESVPNVSEGRDAQVIEALLEAVRRSGEVRILDVSSDADHNRSVLTLAGEPDAVIQGLEALVATAVEKIDLRRHQGRHPRMGAVDVVPLVPIRDLDMADCVRLARDLGERLARRHELPVYLYEEAASAPHRRDLAAVRRGEFEGFPEKMRDPLWQPDFGPARIHPSAGCIAVGAREFLIAFNINLTTGDLEVARRIAQAIRHSSGGLRYVKAMGVMLEERRQAQVSINMTNFRGTPLHRVFEMVRSEAARYGAGIAGSEIVGLVPQDALVQAAEFYLKLEGFDAGRVLERRLAEADPSPSPERG
ncbi:MAG TPA: glutamate formimidoyltransferase [Candidatus Polarisedimenticolia bacterium]|nr:glutamate formimidoyltransferase [Candidatus Polarisedimenticolia bacterium]